MKTRFYAAFSLVFAILAVLIFLPSKPSFPFNEGESDPPIQNDSVDYVDSPGLGNGAYAL